MIDGTLLPLAHLPNAEHFKFIGVKQDGSEVPCYVGKWPTGEYYVCSGVPYSELIGWKQCT